MTSLSAAKKMKLIFKRVNFALFFCLFTSLAFAAAPKGAIKINNDAAYAYTPFVTLTLSATDTGTGISQMKFSNSKSTWSIWSNPEAYKTTKAWVLASGNGTKTVYVKFKDNANNWSGAYSDTIVLNDLRPKITQLTPPEGATFYENDSVQILPTATNPDKSALEYQFSVNGIIKQPWFSQPNYTWTAACGNQKIKVEVRNKFAQDAKEITVYAYKKPLSPP